MGIVTGRLTHTFDLQFHRFTFGVFKCSIVVSIFNAVEWILQLLMFLLFFFFFFFFFFFSIFFFKDLQKEIKLSSVFLQSVALLLFLYFSNYI